MNKTKNQVTASLAEVALGYIGEDPEANLPKLLKWVDRIDSKDAYKGARDFLRDILDHPQGNWYKYIIGLWNDLDAEVRKVLFKNFFVNSVLIGRANQKDLAKTHGCNLPWAILMDPTSACNLHCTGCWAAEYGNKLNMDYATLDSIIRQGKDLGTYMYIYSGGEPLVRKKDVIKLCEAHPDCQFLAFTNGTLIDEEFAKEMLRVKNFIPAISIEGFEKETDFRRGKGTYQAVVKAMEILKEHHLPFGISCCYTSQNVEVIGSERYIDSMIEMGAKFAWFFTYIPVGDKAVPSLMASAEQRKFMYTQLRAMRKTKPIFTMDFWNDGEFVQGCIAGGRCYLHINANGDIEPCAFIHYSDSNIHEKTLLEAFKSPLFMQYYKNQPFNENHLRPCPLLDNPERLRSMIHATQAASTDLEHPEDVDDLTAKCESASERWAKIAEELWA
ncbi:radical SAM protein [uncultured Sphaerochaeta sp.]|uniref:radical SAM protein n=1 Tax=uncultured Sphaerochaeta sp. TaxID=886478 RepID=UPI002A0A10D3|nr:radical SAM protein [uncultured Sphaerochaeta sp.]